MFRRDQRLKDDDKDIRVALSMLFRISWKLLCCPICLMICVTESGIRISIFDSTQDVQKRTEDDTNEGEYDEL